jgi:uncharacterized repeat protein (TIGR03803 family)
MKSNKIIALLCALTTTIVYATTNTQLGEDPALNLDSDEVLYSFQGGSNDVIGQKSTLVSDYQGNMYGTATGISEDGSVVNNGTVFKITPQGQETTLHIFQGGSDGIMPRGGLVMYGDGNLYGTTYVGGSSNNGTVFKITPQGQETVLYSFQGGADGANPWAGLYLGVDGNFYGTTAYGGNRSNHGTVFKITPQGQETVLYSFQGGADGANPWAGLYLGVDGNFYGTTAYGGNRSNHGTVFKITPQGQKTVLYSFQGGADGANPAGDLIEFNGVGFRNTHLYGTTLYGGSHSNGTVFQVDPSTKTDDVLYSFTGGSDGGNPIGNIIIDSKAYYVQGFPYYNIYGVTMTGGSNNNGTVFQMDTDGVLLAEMTDQYIFQGSDGANPSASLLLDGNNDNLYAITANGGSNNAGTVLKITQWYGQCAKGQC